jgi:hypothetical protein
VVQQATTVVQQATILACACLGLVSRDICYYYLLDLLRTLFSLRIDQFVRMMVISWNIEI